MGDGEAAVGVAADADEGAAEAAEIGDNNRS
jgi:hypothetical protein